MRRAQTASYQANLGKEIDIFQRLIEDIALRCQIVPIRALEKLSNEKKVVSSGDDISVPK